MKQVINRSSKQIEESQEINRDTRLLQEISGLLRENNAILKRIESMLVEIKEDSRKIRFNTQ